jgi:nitrile hydratase accessory protein
MNTALSLEGAPRKNGELVFDEPWQARAFGLAITVAEQGTFDWEDFRRRLIVSVAATPTRPYWESWLGALEAWLAELGLTG